MCVIDADHLRRTKSQKSCIRKSFSTRGCRINRYFSAADRSLFARRISSHDHDKMKSPFSRLPPPTYVAADVTRSRATTTATMAYVRRKMYGKYPLRGWKRTETRASDKFIWDATCRDARRCTSGSRCYLRAI